MIKKTGFTFIEVIATLVIIVILTTVALPSYQQYVVKTRRSDAYIALMLAAAEQERVFAINNRYLSDINLLGGAISPEKFYELTVDLTNTGYILRAMAMPETSQALDEDCQIMTLNNLGIKLPEICW